MFFYGPLVIVYLERVGNKSAAFKREYQVWKLTKKKKEGLIFGGVYEEGICYIIGDSYGGNVMLTSARFFRLSACPGQVEMPVGQVHHAGDLSDRTSQKSRGN